MIATLTTGTEVVDGRREWTREERFVATSLRDTTGLVLERLLERGIRVVVDKTETGTVMGWAFIRYSEHGPRRYDGARMISRDPFVFVCRPWLGTQVGEEIRDRLLRELGA